MFVNKGLCAMRLAVEHGHPTKCPQIRSLQFDSLTSGAWVAPKSSRLSALALKEVIGHPALNFDLWLITPK